ncbi:MAG TPA: hypothetical protein VF939_09480 [Puia sp.]
MTSLNDQQHSRTIGLYPIFLLFFSLLITFGPATSMAQSGTTPKKNSMNTEKRNNSEKRNNPEKLTDSGKLTNPVVKKAIEALQTGNADTWFSLFTNKAELFDDGHKVDLITFFKKALGHERFISLDKVENEGLDLYGRFHSDNWGEFQTYFKFQIDAAGKIHRLDIGQASY